MFHYFVIAAYRSHAQTGSPARLYGTDVHAETPENARRTVIEALTQEGNTVGETLVLAGSAAVVKNDDVLSAIQ
jgi:hypothetical protein